LATPWATRRRQTLIYTHTAIYTRGRQATGAARCGWLASRQATCSRHGHRAVEGGACARAPTMATIDEILPRHPISLVAMDSFAPFRGGNGSGSHVDLSCAPFIIHCHRRVARRGILSDRLTHSPSVLALARRHRDAGRLPRRERHRHGHSAGHDGRVAGALNAGATGHGRGLASGGAFWIPHEAYPPRRPRQPRRCPGVGRARRVAGHGRRTHLRSLQVHCAHGHAPGGGRRRHHGALRRHPRVLLCGAHSLTAVLYASVLSYELPRGSSPALRSSLAQTTTPTCTATASTSSS
jgi:hypothetical protein